MTDRPILIGLTGSIGMGKSTTAQMFADLDIPVWDADEAVARLYQKDGAAVEPIGVLVPPAVQNGVIDRAVLKERIASDPNLLSRIEKIVHPLVQQDRELFIANNAKAYILVLDIPLLFETGADLHVDHVVVVSASTEVQRQRVLSRDGIDEKTLEMFLAIQTSDEEKRERSDYVIETLKMDETRAAVLSLVNELRG